MMLDVCIHADGEMLVDAIYTSPIAGIEPPIRHGLQVGITLTDVERIARLRDVHQLSDVRQRNGAATIGIERLAMLIERIGEVEVHHRIVVVAVHRVVLVVAVVVHVLPAELLLNLQIIIHIAIIVRQRLAVVQHQAHAVLVLTVALFRRVGSIECQQSPVVGIWQFTDSMRSTDSPLWTQPVQTIQMVIVIVIAIADACPGRDREVLRQTQPIGQIATDIIIIVRTIIVLVTLVDGTHLT